MAFTSYWIFPLFSAIVWVAMLAAMIGKWLADGSPHYPSMSPNQHIAYISDVGAAAPAPNRSGLKPLFIAMSATSVVTLDVAFLADRWLRHKGRLTPNTTTGEKVLSVIASIFAIAGGAGIILLSCFDTYNYPRAHDGFLLLFIAGYILAAIFLCAEYQRMGIHHREIRILAVSFWIKLVFIVVEIVLAIAFVSENFAHKGNPNVAAVLEWVVALIFTFWVLSFIVDLWPIVEQRDGKGRSGMDQVELGNGDPQALHAPDHRYSGSTAGGLGTEAPYQGDGSRTQHYRNGRQSPGLAF